MPPVRVLHVCDFLFKYTGGLAGGMVANGVSAAMLSRDHDFEYGGEPGAMRSDVRERMGPDAPHITYPGRVRDAGSWRPSVRAHRWVRRFAPDVVHHQNTVVNDPRLILAAGRLRAGSFAYTLHDVVVHPGDEGDSAARRKLSDWLLRNAAVTFVHAAALRDDLHALHGDGLPVAVVPHGVDEPDPQPLPREPRVLFFGRVSHYKGVDVLLDALGPAWERLPELEVTIAGEGRLPDHPRLADPRVTVRNEHIPEAEVPALFAASRCVVLPYREASQSGVGSNAKCFGRPQIVTSTGGLPELVADGSGVVVPPEDPSALADAIVDVLTTPGRAEALARVGPETVRRESGWDHVARLTLDAYRAHGLTGQAAPG